VKCYVEVFTNKEEEDELGVENKENGQWQKMREAGSTLKVSDNKLSVEGGDKGFVQRLMLVCNLYCETKTNVDSVYLYLSFCNPS
jgi:hypothetical protein